LASFCPFYLAQISNSASDLLVPFLLSRGVDGIVQAFKKGTGERGARFGEVPALFSAIRISPESEYAEYLRYEPAISSH
jgi:hypothetical protein